MFKLKTAAVLVAALGLVACGGSSDLPDNPVGEPLPITTSNYVRVTQEVLAASVSLVDVSELPLQLLGTSVSTATSPVAYARNRLPLLTQLTTSGLPTGSLPLVTGTLIPISTYYCTGGGTIVTTLDDRDENGILSVGDAVIEAYNACIEGTETANGRISYAFNALTGDLTSVFFTASIGLTFENFQISSSVTSVLANGSLTVDARSNGLDDQTSQLTAQSYREEITYAGVTNSRTYTNFSTHEQRSTTLVTVTVNGTLTSSVFGGRAIVITTTAPLAISYPGVYPASGQLVATGAASSTVRITAVSDTTVQLDLDADGNGTVDATSWHFWSEFI
jgi:hypothetical protein